MNAPEPTTAPPIATRRPRHDLMSLAAGTPAEDGFFAGLFQLDDGRRFALIVAPKAEGEKDDATWIDGYQAVPGARSYNDGLANTQAMAAAGSPLAQWALGLRIGEHDDWYLPSQDELEICYRNLKPTSQENTCWARSGINLSAVPQSRPYTPTFPLQTPAEAFHNSAAEAFATTWYWSSTQHAATSGYAWYQSFNDGLQDISDTSLRLRARAVRRVAI
jgi:hypothetical protein